MTLVVKGNILAITIIRIKSRPIFAQLLTQLRGLPCEHPWSLRFCKIKRTRLCPIRASTSSRRWVFCSKTRPISCGVLFRHPTPFLDCVYFIWNTQNEVYGPSRRSCPALVIRGFRPTFARNVIEIRGCSKRLRLKHVLCCPPDLTGALLLRGLDDQAVLSVSVWVVADDMEVPSPRHLFTNSAKTSAMRWHS